VPGKRRWRSRRAELGEVAGRRRVGEPDSVSRNPGGQHDPPTGCEHARHVGESRGGVRSKDHREDRDDHVDRVIGQRDRCRLALDYFQGEPRVGSARASDLDESSGRVDGHDIGARLG
jgi:hypothetical protein